MCCQERWIKATRMGMLLLLAVVGWRASGSAASPTSQVTREVRIVPPTVVVDQTVTVGIEVVATGGEQSVALSLRYDPTILSRPAVALGTGRGEAGPAGTPTFLANWSGSSQGQLGLTWNLPAGQTLSAGTHSLFRVTFRVESAGGALPSATLSLGDLPVGRKITDAAGAPLAAGWIDARVSLASLPVVTILPTSPTSHDSVSFTLAGIWSDACIPRQPVLRRTDRLLRIETTTLGEFCAQVLTPYTLPVSLGKLEPGTYQVEVVHVFARSSIRLGSFSLTVQMGLTSTNAGNYAVGQVARGSIVAAFGTRLATGSESAPTLPLPTSLGGTTAIIRDVTGTDRPAPLFFVSPQQVNYQVPVETIEGPAKLTLTNRQGETAMSRLEVVRVAPALFTMDGSGQGLPVASLIRTTANGQQTQESVWRAMPGGGIVPRPIPLGPSTDDLFVVLYGTGLRFRSALSHVTVTIGGVASQVLYLGESGGYVGLDQCNVRIPRSLQGRGVVDVTLIVDGIRANPVQLTIE
ncbi:MAG: hypothetical protein ACOYNR_06985 [Blastocatellia bacterium]